jgi:hypothetical protein
MLCHNFLIGNGHTCALEPRVFWEDTRQPVERGSETYNVMSQLDNFLIGKGHTCALRTTVRNMVRTIGTLVPLVLSIVKTSTTWYQWYQSGTNGTILPYMVHGTCTSGTMVVRTYVLIMLCHNFLAF